MRGALGDFGVGEELLQRLVPQDRRARHLPGSTTSATAPSASSRALCACGQPPAGSIRYGVRRDVFK
ncbi:hypothetical protein SMD44_08735 [Streptomyces alboflavus]|uniref:Uncharacterized protein n=1 Tax=Streptomyces alboflavus TaxID=67267 RepID=A0A1Z1WS41_9ACTN|nr:hypothetical protein SMD44_08735 [Streptomyces alboflavus]